MAKVGTVGESFVLAKVGETCWYFEHELAISFFFLSCPSSLVEIVTALIGMVWCLVLLVA